MIHENKTEFREILERTSAATGFPLHLMEKDYYLTILLSGINRELDEKLVFKGGTCLNKIYYEYFRLSEDLDFTMLLPEEKSGRTTRSRIMDGIKRNIKKYAESFGLRLDETKQIGRNENRQYIYSIEYDSTVTATKNSIKLEIGLRANPYLPLNKMKIKHLFKNPFTGAYLFEPGEIQCLSLVEIAAEKVRAATTRKEIAPRDFFDLHYFIKREFDFNSKEFLVLVEKKLAEDGFDRKGREIYKNLSRSETEIKDMKSRLEKELYPVLTAEAAKSFDIEAVLKYFNKLAIS